VARDCGDRFETRIMAVIQIEITGFRKTGSQLSSG
jgi:hypothetical protein